MLSCVELNKSCLCILEQLKEMCRSQIMHNMPFILLKITFPNFPVSSIFFFFFFFNFPRK